MATVYSHKLRPAPYRTLPSKCYRPKSPRKHRGPTRQRPTPTLAYPDALAELWMGDRLEGLDNLRDYYLQRARQLGALGDGATWFTDKMPLNETHLGLIGLIFPKAPILHVVRHPLDVALSVFSNHLTHGFYCAYDLMSIARHYVLVMDLVEHYRRETDLRYLRVRYEDVTTIRKRGWAKCSILSARRWIRAASIFTKTGAMRGRPDLLGGRRCGRTKIADAMTGAGCAIRAT